MESGAGPRPHRWIAGVAGGPVRGETTCRAHRARDEAFSLLETTIKTHKTSRCDMRETSQTTRRQTKRDRIFARVFARAHTLDRNSYDTFQFLM